MFTVYKIEAPPTLTNPLPSANQLISLEKCINSMKEVQYSERPYHIFSLVFQRCNKGGTEEALTVENPFSLL